MEQGGEGRAWAASRRVSLIRDTVGTSVQLHPYEHYVQYSVEHPFIINSITLAKIHSQKRPPAHNDPQH